MLKHGLLALPQPGQDETQLVAAKFLTSFIASRNKSFVLACTSVRKAESRKFMS